MRLDFINVRKGKKVGGGRGVMRVGLYNKKKHRLLIRNIDNLSLGLRSRLDLVLSCTRFFFHHLFF